MSGQTTMRTLMENVSRLSALAANEPNEEALEHRLLAIWQDAVAALKLIEKADDLLDDIRHEAGSARATPPHTHKETT